MFWGQRKSWKANLSVEQHQGSLDCVTSAILTFATLRTKKGGELKTNKINKGCDAGSNLKAAAGLRLRNNGDNYTPSEEL